MPRTARILPAIALVLPLLAAPALAQVSGHCYLAEQADHSGISVVFTAGSPSAVTDSTLTDVAGAYSIALEIGIYDVEYRKDGYLPHTLPDAIFHDGNPLALDDVTLEPGSLIEVSGSIGTAHWTSGTTVRILDTASVSVLDTLTIDPGVEVLCPNGVSLCLLVYGTALFRGVEGDSIVFRPEDPAAGNAGQVRFTNDTGSVVEYCVFRKLSQVKLDGGGMWPSTFEFSHCTVDWGVEGLNLHAQAPVIVSDCDIHDNSFRSLRLLNADGDAVIERCRLAASTGGELIRVEGCDGSLFEDCVLESSDADWACQFGFENVNSDVLIRGCEISDCWAAGIYLNGESSSMSIENCLIERNGGGILATDSRAAIRNNTIVDNTGIGLQTEGAPETGPIVFDNIFSGNDGGLLLNGGVDRLEYNDIHGNTVDAAGAGLPLGYGSWIMTNANGDPADVYLNISLDPLFEDPFSGDYHLQAGSPCIDAGDPAYLDPDGTAADLGCFYRDAGTGAGDTAAAAFRLSPCFPNPFNPQTTLRFMIDDPREITLTIHDLSGRRVRSLFHGRCGAGTYVIEWDGRDDRGVPVVSGTYFSRMTDGVEVRSTKLTLLK